MIIYDQPWQRAAARFEDDGFDYGDMVTHQWIHQAMDIPPFEGDDIGTIESHQLLILRNRTLFKQWLLTNKEMYLESLTGIGYRIVLSKEQTDAVMKKTTNDIFKAIGRGKQGLKHVNKSLLSDRQKTDNEDAKARLQQMSGFSRTTLPMRRSIST